MADSADEFQIARKACNLQYKTDFGDSGIHQNQTFPHACPKVVPEGPEVVKGGALGDFGVPLGTLVVPFASPRTHLGVPLARPGSIWGLTETLWGSPGGIEASNYINKLPINRQSGQMLITIGSVQRKLRINLQSGQMLSSIATKLSKHHGGFHYR